MKSELIPIAKIISQLSKKLRIQYLLIVFFMILSSIADVISIGAVLPFLAAISSPDIIFDNDFAKEFFQYFGYTKADELIAPLTIFFIFAVALSGLFRVLQFVLNAKISHISGAYIGVKVFKKALAQDYMYHKLGKSNEIKTIIASKIDELIIRTLQPLLQITTSIMLVIFIISFLLVLNPRLIIITSISLVSIYLIISAICYKLLERDSNNIASKRISILKIASEGFSNIKNVIVDKLFKKYEDEYEKAEYSLRESLVNIGVIANIPRYILETFSIIAIAVIGFFYSSNSSSFTVIATLGTLAMAGQRLLPAFQQIYGSWATIVGNTAAVNDILELLELKDRKSFEKKDFIFANEIVLDDISFNYPKSKVDTLSNIEIKISKNSFIGIVGMTGSGKTTLLDLILGLIVPNKGKLFVDGLNIDDDEKLNAYQSIISHVPQEVFIGDCSIQENITGNTNMDDFDEELLINAVKDALIFDYIQEQPEKFMSSVGENGSNLSGGQRQRIGIARALYKKANIIVLDEATSALDNFTEKKIINNILQDPNRTVIMVSHSTESIKECDSIYEIENGKIKNFGSFEYLLEISKSFRELSASDK